MINCTSRAKGCAIFDVIKARHVTSECQGNASEGVSINLLPKEVKNETMLTTDIILNGSEQVDTGCMQTLVSRFMCYCWRPRQMDVLTANKNLDMLLTRSDQVGHR